MKSSLYSHTYLTETSFPCSGIGEQDHDVGQLVGGHAVHGGGRQAAAVTVGGGRGGVGGGVGGVFKLLRIDLVCVGERGGLFGGGGSGGGGGRPAFVFNSGQWSSKWVQDGGGGRGGGGDLSALGGGKQQQVRVAPLERDAQQLFAVVGSSYHCEPR